MKALLPLAVLLAGCSHGSKGSHTTTELKQATLSLSQGMPASQIQQVLGPPDEVGSSLCHPQSGDPAQCTTWMYRAQATNLDSTMNLRLWLRGDPQTLDRWEWF